MALSVSIEFISQSNISKLSKTGISGIPGSDRNTISDGGYTTQQQYKGGGRTNLGTSSEKNGIMWEKFPRGQTPPQYGNFFDEIPFFSEDVPKQKNLY